MAHHLLLFLYLKTWLYWEFVLPAFRNCDGMSSGLCYKNNENVVYTAAVSGIMKVTALTRMFSIV